MWKKTPAAPPPKNFVNVRGYFDGIIGRRAVGWLADLTPPLEVPVVEILVGEEVVAEGKANLFRQDLLDAGIGVGNHGFEITLPAALLEGESRLVAARSKRHRLALNGSPKKTSVPLATAGHAFGADLPALENRLARLEDALQKQNELLHAIYAAVANTGSIESFQGVDRGPYFDECRQTQSGMGDIILFSIIDWSFRIQRPQHLCARLAKLGYRVLYVSVQLDTEKPTARSKFEVRANPAPGVFEIRLRVSGKPPSIYSGISDAGQLRDAILAMEELTSTLDVRSPYAILQFPSWLPIAQSIPGAVIVYDCLDHVAGFSNVSKEVAELERQLVRQADMVVTTSAYLHNHVSQTRPSTIIRNGCEFEYFSKRPRELAIHGSRPVVGYFGAIAEWFDSNLVLELATRHPEWDFVLVGSTAGSEIAPLTACKNVSLLGEKPYSELTRYLYGFSVCIIPFRNVELIKATNPVKLYEYLASGKPVVCTDMPEARTAPANLVRVAASLDEFESAVIDAMQEDNEDLPAQRKAWASQNSWDSRASHYVQMLKAYPPKVSVVVLSYNGVEFTKACLQSVEAFSAYPRLEIICVDNRSTDGSREFLIEWARTRPQHKVLLSDENLGFAGGNNLGIEAATGDIFVLLNNDTFVTEGWLQDLIRPLIQDESVGLAGPVTNMIGGIQKVSIQYSNMTEMAERARAFTRGRKGVLYDANALAFFCVAMRRDLVDRVGNLDTIFGIGFFEDDDYCQRVMKAGYRLVCVDGVFVHHHLSAAFNALEPGAKSDIFRKNRTIFEQRWGPWIPHKYRDEPGFGE